MTTEAPPYSICQTAKDEIKAAKGTLPGQQRNALQAKGQRYQIPRKTLDKPTRAWLMENLISWPAALSRTDAKKPRPQAMPSTPIRLNKKKRMVTAA